MKIQLKGYLTFKEFIGEREISLPEGATLRVLLATLLDSLEERSNSQLFNTEGELQPSVAVLINGRHYTHLPDITETQLQEGDQVAIFPPIIGG